jgi:hypothetical protein
LGTIPEANISALLGDLEEEKETLKLLQPGSEYGVNRSFGKRSNGSGKHERIKINQSQGEWNEEEKRDTNASRLSQIQLESDEMTERTKLR